VPDPILAGLTLAGKGANALVTTKIRDQLFGPLAKAYGDHWGLEAKEKLEAKRQEKKAANAQSHVAILAQVHAKRSYEDIFSDRQFEEWIQSASDVDPEVDPDLAEFWRAALIAIAEGDPARDRLLRIVKSLSSDDAVYLATGRFSGPRFVGSNEGGHIRRLEEAGVLGSAWSTLLTLPIKVLLMATFPISIYLAFSIFEQYSYVKEAFRPWESLKVAATILAVFLSLIKLAKVFIKPERLITSDGYRLLKILSVIRTEHVR
jgi:hypothetical protein